MPSPSRQGKTSNTPISSSLLFRFLVIVVVGAVGIFLMTLRLVTGSTTIDAISGRSTMLEESLVAPAQRSLPQLKLPTPVLVVGYPKSGTTSIYQFFNCSRVRTQHYCCCGDMNDHPPCQGRTMAFCILQNMANQRPMMEGCGDYEVYAQIDGERPIHRQRGMPHHQGVLLENGTLELHHVKQPKERQLLFRHFLPQHFHLDQLHADYPHATFILPLRDPHVWANSAFNWYQMRGRTVNEYMFFNSSLERPGKDRAKGFLARIYAEHSEYVRHFVRQYPSHALVEVNITDPLAGEQLAREFGLDFDEACWGHHNKVGVRANTIKRRQQRQKRRKNDAR